MPQIRVTVRNGFFTYFEMDGMPGAFRMLKQVWNAQGIRMMVQGPSWDGNGINGFGKRHLLATAGGKTAGSPEAKAAKIVGKRTSGQGADSRLVTLNQLVNVAAGATPANMRDPAVRDRRNEKKNTIREGFLKGYEPDVYGPGTDICTFVILDGLTPQQAADCFAIPIRARGMVEGQVARVVVEFDAPRVINAWANGDIEYYYAMEIEIKLFAGIHHIYHCHGAQMHQLGRAFEGMFS